MKALDLQGRHVVAVAGSGGKTTLVLRLAGELHRAGKRVAVTTTTKMRSGERVKGSRTFLSHRLQDLVDGMESAFESGAIPFLFTDSGCGKNLGLSPETVDGLAERADILLVEADGARGLPLKLPRESEPVVPESTDRYVVVLGAGALGKPAGEETVFNFEGAREFLEDAEGITPRAIAALVHAPEGFLRLARPGRKTFLFVNQADAAKEVEIRELRDRLGHGAVDRIVAGNAGDPEAPIQIFENGGHKVAAIVLAAGESTRFEGTKQTALFHGRPLVSHATEAALQSGAGKTIVVLGHEAEAVRRALDSIPGLCFVMNPGYRKGLSSSIRAGLDAAEGFDAALLVLGDLPFLRGDLAARVVGEYRACTAPLCFPEVRGRPGHPVVFHCGLWDDLGAVRGDEGGRSVIRQYRARARTFTLEDPESQIDIDREGDHAIHGHSR